MVSVSETVTERAVNFSFVFQQSVFIMNGS